MTRPLRKISFHLLVYAFVIGLAAAGLSACGGSGTAAPSSSATSGQVSNAPLVIDLGGGNSEPSSLDPDADYDNGAYSILSQMYSHLVSASGTTTVSIHPDVATTWSQSTDGLTWTFHLRPNVKFHDGSAVNAKAVQFTFNRALTMKQGGWADFAMIKSVDAPDPLTVVFHLKYRFASFLNSLSSVYNGAIVSPTTLLKHQVNGDLGAKWLYDHDAGSGPYELVSWSHGQNVKLQKFPGYWKGWAGNHSSQVVYQFTAASATARLGLENGSIDAAIALSPQDFSALASSSSIGVQNHQSSFVQYLALNCTRGPLKNKLVRLALAYSMNPEQVAKVVWGGYATVAKSYAPMGIPGYVESPIQYTYDLAKAKQLLAQAGYANGFTVDAVIIAGDQPGSLVYQLWQADLTKLNIKLNIKPLPYPQFAKLQQKASTSPDIISNAWGLDYASNFLIYNSFLNSKATSVMGNWAYYANPQVDALLSKVRSEASADSPAALDLYRQIQQISYGEAPYIPMVQEPARIAIASRVHGYEYNLAETPYFFNVYDMWKSN
jgi:peptide/nickel transport system substrate-binding protein